MQCRMINVRPVMFTFKVQLPLKEKSHTSSQLVEMLSELLFVMLMYFYLVENKPFGNLCMVNV